MVEADAVAVNTQFARVIAIFLFRYAATGGASAASSHHAGPHDVPQRCLDRPASAFLAIHDSPLLDGIVCPSVVDVGGAVSKAIRVRDEGLACVGLEHDSVFETICAGWAIAVDFVVRHQDVLQRRRSGHHDANTAQEPRRSGVYPHDDVALNDEVLRQSGIAHQVTMADTESREGQGRGQMGSRATVFA